MSTELPKAYDPKQHEEAANDAWRASGYANPDKLPGQRKEAYSIAMPPPNATGILHIGHSVMLALQDILIRFERMRGKKTLWVPGTDHAAIATQNVVEQELKREGKTKHDLGREKFLERVDTFVKDSQGTIKKQVERMGASCDWSRERFTLDEGMTNAVDHAFTELYDDGLIYRGTRVVNWCPKDQSTLADDEVEYKEKQTTLVTFKYDKDFPIAIATTRPETKFGDTGVAVNPKDERYKQYVGKTFTVHFAGVKRDIKVVTDRGVDMEYGTGALGVTPAHSAIDEKIAQREKLPSVKVIDEEGKMTNEAGPEFSGLYANKARAKIIEWLRTEGLLQKEASLTHNVAICYRCGTTIEPLPSKQWFIAVDKPTKKLGGKTLKERMLQVADKHEIAFVPGRFENVYRQWIENLHDWCISRQIWYGHRVPLEGETDTLDTWFSSALWTFSTLGWPEKTKDLKTFHPTTVMETGYDIIFFWVARMILMSTYFLQEIPFKTVYLHGLVRDEKGRKMSKSLNNGIDPLAMADKYGADAVRLALVIGTTPGNDQKLSEQKIAGFRNYANKLWNIGRLYQMRFATESQSSEKDKPGQSLADRWILSRLTTLIEEVTNHLEKYEFSTAGEKVYHFAWHEFADWFLEIAKLESLATTTHYVFENVLKLLHPFMPFVTETLWKKLGFGKDLLMIAEWPKAEKKFFDENAEKEFAAFQERVASERKEKGKAFNLRDALQQSLIQ